MGTSQWEPVNGNQSVGTSQWEPVSGNQSMGTSQCPHCKQRDITYAWHLPHALSLPCRCQIRNKKKGKFTMTGTSNASSSGLQRTGSEISDSMPTYAFQRQAHISNSLS